MSTISFKIHILCTHKLVVRAEFGEGYELHKMVLSLVCAS